MRGNVFTGQLAAGLGGLQALSMMLRRAGVMFEPSNRLESVMMAPEGLNAYQLNDYVVITLVGDSASGYLFTITVVADADTADRFASCLMTDEAWVPIGNLQRQEITFGMTPDPIVTQL